MKTAFGIAIVLGTAAVFTLNAPDAQAGRNKHHHGHSYHSDKVPTYLVNNLDETAQDPGSPGNMWVGSGIPATNFILRNYEYAGIELAIKAHLRQGADILPSNIGEDGLVHVEVPTGSQPGVPDRAAWNFTFSYDVALKSGNPDLEDYRGYLLIDVDPSKRTRYLKLKLVKLPGTPTGQASGYGWASRGVVAIPDDEGTSQVTQNSQNLAFYEDLIDADPYTPGKQSYAATDYGPGQFDVQMVLQHKYSRRKAELHVVFDVVEP
jgi:hypothetical protein